VQGESRTKVLIDPSMKPSSSSSSGDPIDYLRRYSSVPRMSEAHDDGADDDDDDDEPQEHRRPTAAAAHDNCLRRHDSDDDGVAYIPTMPRAHRLSYRPQSIPKAKKDNNDNDNDENNAAAEEEPPARARPETGNPWPYRETLSFTRNLIFYGAGSITAEHETACQHIQEARTLRQQYQGGKATRVEDSAGRVGDLLLAKSDRLTFTMRPNGVAEIYDDDSKTNLVVVPSIDDFAADYKRLEEICKKGAMRSFCFQRLQLLATSFKMYVCLFFYHKRIMTPIQYESFSLVLYRTLVVIFLLSFSNVYCRFSPSKHCGNDNRSNKPYHYFHHFYHHQQPGTRP
jgi:hypothetical protein